MAKKKIKMIRVETLPNGYCLKFDGMKNPTGYMYFTPEALLEGFMLHIGLGITEQLNTETMQDFLVTCINWNENKKCVKEIQNITSELRRMTGHRNALANRLIVERNQHMSLYDKIGSVLKENKDETKIGLCKKIKEVLKNKNKLYKLTVEGLCGGKGSDDDDEEDE